MVNECKLDANIYIIHDYNKCKDNSHDPCQNSLGKEGKQTFGVPPAAPAGAKTAHKHTLEH